MAGGNINLLLSFHYQWAGRFGKRQKSAAGGSDAHSISADPLFVDVENEDFRLRPESPMFKLGFKQIDTGKIGLTQDFPERYK